MPARGYRPPQPDRVATNTDGLDDIAQRRAREELLPMIAQKNRNAIGTVPHRFELFVRKHVGRKCSCFKIEDDALGSCPICFSVGIVGGFQKRGTALHVLDITHPNVRLLNVAVDYQTPSRPYTLSLRSTAVFGELNWTIELQPNVGLLDLWEMLAYEPTGSSVTPYVRAPSETSFTPATPEAMRVRLGHRKLHVRVIFERNDPSAPLPKLIGIRFAYKTLAISSVPMDVPLNTYSIVMQEYGIETSFSQQTFQADNTVHRFSTEDLLYDVEQGAFWKVVEVTPNNPFGTLLGHQLQVRILQPFEPSSKVPTGDVPALQQGTFALNSRQVLEQQLTHQGTYQQPMGRPIQGGRFPQQADQANPVNNSGLPPGSQTIDPHTVRRR